MRPAAASQSTNSISFIKLNFWWRCRPLEGELIDCALLSCCRRRLWALAAPMGSAKGRQAKAAINSRMSWLKRDWWMNGNEWINLSFHFSVGRFGAQRAGGRKQLMNEAIWRIGEWINWWSRAEWTKQIISSNQIEKQINLMVKWIVFVNEAATPPLRSKPNFANQASLRLIYLLSFRNIITVFIGSNPYTRSYQIEYYIYLYYLFTPYC